MTKDIPEKTSTISTKPTALVAGGAGFIGSFLCQSLLFQGCRVVAVDNFSSGNKDNLSLCWDNENFQFYEHDLTKNFPENIRADYIFHVAGMENRPDTKLQNLIVNSQGTHNLLLRAKEWSAKFLLASSLSLPVVKDGGFRKITGRLTKVEKLETAREFAEELAVEFFQKGVDVRIARLGPLYGPRMDLNSRGEISAVFGSFLVPKVRVKIYAEKMVRPLFISDAVFGLMKLMFSVSSSSGQIYTLAGDEEVSLYDLCHRVGKKYDQACQLDFISGTKGQRDKSRGSLPKNNFNWRPAITLDEGIERTLDYFAQYRPGETTKRFMNTAPVKVSVGLTAEETEKEKKETREQVTVVVQRTPELPTVKKVAPVVSSKRHYPVFKFFLPFFLVCLLAVSPFLPLLLKTGLTGWFDWRSYQAYEKNQLEEWVLRAGKAYRWSQGMEAEAKKISQLFPRLERKIDLPREAWYVRRFTYINYEVAQLAQEAQRWNKTVFQAESGEQELKTFPLTAGLERLWWELAYVESDLNQSRRLPYVLQWLERKTTYRLTPAELSKYRRFLFQAKEMVPFLPQLLGFEEEKNYLLLFQNNMELRPTGGFIGSFGLISFKQGKLNNLEVYDVYDADGQLKGHVEPPLPIRTYLNEANWYLRDSNWDPNFPTSALRAGWFLEKTLGKEVDGVIGLNLYFLEELLRKIGPVQLVDYEEEITAENIFLLTEKHAESDFFPGSKEKKDFLSSLIRSLAGRLEEGQMKITASFVGAVLTAGEQKEVSFYFADEELESLFGRFNWDGSLRKTVCLGVSDCQSDYLMIVEANLGVNKANYYLDRQLALEIDLSSAQSVSHRLLIDYKNNSTQSDLYGGSYKNYLRLYLPLGTEVEGVYLDEKKIGASEITEEIEAGKSVVGFLVNVPPEGNRRVEVVYSQTLVTREGYTLFWQRQPGSDRSPVTISGAMSPTSLPPTFFGAQSTASGFEYQGVLENDFWLGF